MPTSLPEPTIAELVQAFHDGVRSQRDRYADGREGAVYDHFAGVGAIHWSRQARRDTDMFRAIYFATAEGADLTKLLDERYAFERVEDTYGTGEATLARASLAAAGGTIWAGTRIAIVGDFVLPKVYVVLADTAVSSTEATAKVAVRASLLGPGTAIRFDTSSSALRARVDDPLWDTTWTVSSLTCDDGTSFESAAASRARYRLEQRDARVGFVESMVAACKEAGAENAVFFPSDYGGDEEDHGLNMAYVGDAGFSATAALVRAVQKKLESYRVLGDNLQVRRLTRTNLVFDVDVTLWDSPARVNQPGLTSLLRDIVVGYFDGVTRGFSYDLDAIVGAFLRASSAVQFATFRLPASSAGVLSIVGGALNFPSELARYRVAPDDVTINLLPPS